MLPNLLAFAPLRFVGRAAASMVGVISLLVLTGWTFDIAALKSVVPGFIAMQPWTALSFWFGASALWMAASGARSVRAASAVPAIALAIAAGLPLMEYVTDTSFGTDVWLFRNSVVLAQTHKYPTPGRMSLAAAIGLTAQAGALLLAPRAEGRVGRMVLSILATTGMVFAMTALIGYVLRLEPLNAVFLRNPLALHSALALAMLSIGIHAQRTDAGWIRVATENGASGWLTAAMLAIAIIFLAFGSDAARRAGTIEAGVSDVSFRLQMILSTLKDAETGQRGYLLTGRDSYLEPYEAARAHLSDELVDTQAFFVKAQDFPTDLTRLRGLADQELAELQETIGLRRGGDAAGALLVVESGRGAALMDAIRAEVASLTRITAENATARGTRARWTTTIAVVGLMVIAAITRWVLIVAWHGRKQAVNQLVMRERQLRLFIDGAPAAIAMLDTAMRSLAVSRRFIADYRLVGQTPEALVGRSHYQLFPDTSARWQDLHRRVLAGETLSSKVEAWPRADGGIDGLSWEMTPWRHADGTVGGALLFSENMTDRKESAAALQATQERLNQAQKMEAIGQLSGGIAHDFNNVLQVMMGNLGLIHIRSHDASPDVAQLAVDALDAGSRAAALTGQRLTFAGRQKLGCQVLNPLSVVEGMRPLFARALGDRIHLQTKLEDNVGFLWTDRNLLESALLNLVIKARDSIGGQAGTITISVSVSSITSLAGEWPPTGTYVRIAVADNGAGMTDEPSQRDFEPFFTTKGEHAGGLDLAQLHGFVRQAGGTMMIQTVLGQGTEVAILLPRHADPLLQGQSDAAARPNDATPVGLGETVLLVDDDAAVRTSMAAMLRSLGYDPIEAETAHAGFLLLLSTPSIRAIISGLSMSGGMDGLDLAVLAEEQRPNVPILLVTGNPDSGRLRQPPSRVVILHKPYSRDQLGHVLWRIIAKGGDDPGAASADAGRSTVPAPALIPAVEARV